ncbi:MAG: hypothetical protein KIT16_20435 [Rhodospirillaceae bacterium]|nr:hypothetical protein [Rhodospirillaceae bacterium]
MKLKAVPVAALAAIALGGCVANSVQELRASPGATHTSTHPGKLADIYPILLRQMEKCNDGRYATGEQKVSYALLVGPPRELLRRHVRGSVDLAAGKASIVAYVDPEYPRIQSATYHTDVELVQKGPVVELTVSAKNWVVGSKRVHERIVTWLNGKTGCSLRYLDR